MSKQCQLNQPVGESKPSSAVKIVSPVSLIEAALRYTTRLDDGEIIKLWEKHRNALLQEFNRRSVCTYSLVRRIAEYHQPGHYVLKNDPAAIHVTDKVTSDVNLQHDAMSITISLKFIFDEIRYSGIAYLFSKEYDRERLTSYIRMQMYALIAEAGYSIRANIPDRSKPGSITLFFNFAPNTCRNFWDTHLDEISSN